LAVHALEDQLTSPLARSPLILHSFQLSQPRGEIRELPLNRFEALMLLLQFVQHMGAERRTRCAPR